jgi:hypothetical protein
LRLHHFLQLEGLNGLALQFRKVDLQNVF